MLAGERSVEQAPDDPALRMLLGIVGTEAAVVPRGARRAQRVGGHQIGDEGRQTAVRPAGQGFGVTLGDIRSLMAAADRGCCGEVVPKLDRTATADSATALATYKIDEIPAGLSGRT